MNLNKALEIFNIKDIGYIDKALLKKDYRRLLKENHPDNKKDNKFEIHDIVEAYKLISSIEKKINVESRNNVIITLDNLLRVYSGEVINNKIDKKYILKNNTSVLSIVNIITKYRTYNFSSISEHNLNDTYFVNCDIQLDNDNEIEIVVVNKKRKLKMSMQTLEIVFTLLHNIKIRVIINKKDGG